ncbi:VacJ family lipoprotein [Aliiroseovarius sp. YM-037]|uniref:MlaA family lipoprotein n=1 Tax=Aliiroseovarius sp. YM-037 TaxID=3341728 RepID=UPI003A7FD8C7
MPEAAHSRRFRVSTLFVIGALMLVTACAQQPAGGIQDPHEEQNRRVHAANRDIDRVLLRPTANAYGGGLPQPVRQGVGNFASNLGLPSKVVNNLLQLDIEGAFQNTFRFAFNSTIGLAGVLDPATEAGLTKVDTDFGETLYVWGVPEGNYVELPVLGPSTERHMVGRVVDLFTNPLSYAIDAPESYVVVGANTLSRVGDRYDYSATVDSVLYESEDSYAQARSLYLQNRRFKLGAEVTEAEADEIDALFEDLYGE